MRGKKQLFGKISDSVFINEQVLYPEFVPDIIFHRDAEINSLVYALNPATQGKMPLNIFACGSTGTGKTASVRYVLRELEASTDRAKSLYLNCFEFNSRVSILFKVAGFLGAAVPRRGMSVSELYDKLLEFLKKSDFIPIIVLDEADQLLYSEEESKVLYDLLRVMEFQQKKICLILISNDRELTMKLDARIRSSLSEQALEFKKYSPQELKDILRDRAEKAFHANSFDEELIGVAAAHAGKLGGDARIAIDSLLKAGRNADRENAPTIELSHLKNAFIEVDSASILKSIEFLDENQKKILKLISSRQELNSGELYEMHLKSEKNPLSDRSVREIVSMLEEKKIISTELISLGNKGKTKKIKLNAPKEAVEKKLK